LRSLKGLGVPNRLHLSTIALVAGMPGIALAGPPFVTDDPEPTDLGHWEIYNYVQGAETEGIFSGSGGFDINYGGFKDVQLTAVVPANFDTGGHARGGLGDIELATKYLFLHQQANGWMPDLAIFPRLFVPTANRHFGSGHLGVFLPLWAQKDFGQWSLFGGGGYDINPGPGQRNYWQGGVALSRALTDRFSLGMEVYRQTADADAATPFTVLNLAATYAMTEHWTLMISGGPVIENAAANGRYDVYFALEATY
jgi:hypothetical protein